MKIGLEIHSYPNTKSKMYCTCSTDFLKAEPNTNICPICTAQPGSKPMAINKRALESGIQIALLLNCELVKNQPIETQRKHYFYPDLPSNYQRTSKPFAVNGKLNGVRITEIHWEEDPGQYELRTGEVDYNRSGMPLLEIVTEPDLKSPAEARDFLNDLRLIFDYSQLGRRDLSFKVDTNISVGEERVEVKNINSIRGVEAAAAYEEKRQREALDSGEGVRRETRHFDERFNMTMPLREKETAADYRYFPDPDLQPVVITDAWIEEIKKSMPESPIDTRKKLMERYNISKEMANNLLSEREFFAAFGEVVKQCDAKLAIDWFLRDLKSELNYRSKTFAEAKLSTKTIIDLLTLLQKNKITMMVAKTLLRKWLDGNDITKEIDAAQKAESAIVGEEDMKRVVADVITQNEKVVQDYRKGKEAAMNVIVGMVMKELKGKGDPKTIRAIALHLIQQE